jgi:hypothetical protein
MGARHCAGEGATLGGLRGGRSDQHVRRHTHQQLRLEVCLDLLCLGPCVTGHARCANPGHGHIDLELGSLGADSHAVYSSSPKMISARMLTG